MNQFLNMLRLCWLREHCDFDKYLLDKAIKDQLIEHCHSNTLRWRLLCDKATVSLSSLLLAPWSRPIFRQWTLNMPCPGNTKICSPTLSEEEQVNFTSDKLQQGTLCSNHPKHQPWTPRCPAFRKTCSQCGNLNHFGRKCMRRTIPGHPNGKWH